MPSNYRKEPAYQWYVAGDNKRRPSGLPPFDTDSQRKVILAAGEKYCRWSDDGGTTLCHNRNQYSSSNGLKHHIREAHLVDVAPSAPGGLSSRDDNLTCEYWQDIYDVAHGVAATPKTPRKDNAVAIYHDLKEIPWKAIDDGTEEPDFDRMKINIGMGRDDVCEGCAG